MTTLHPFGTTITDATLRQTFAPLNQWEDKYRQLILLGKKLPTLTDERKAQAGRLPGVKTASGWAMRRMPRAGCTSLATAKDGLCAVCWRYF